ncbi:MAG: UDP-N-acetylmuramoyl-tripeptide--D-alanyl-D-alanine ligase [Eubacteriales bacterium]|nr:UDP-N-acetylmuramoyl-tripeptide--D-alanyl-D-alanine ligase [Eubacteriales bacterium]MDD4421460.1 UDP-N-acetylmuramoyl-tripeptide--D-alanyl-D-alanine ligase [Eubacteriales bacterium]
MKLTIQDISDAVGGRISGRTNKNSIVNSVFLDSREADINKNGLFVVIRGEHVDAHCFVKYVTAKGCYALIEDEDYFTDNCILVDSTRQALQKLAEWYRGTRLKKTKIIAVTGSVGKTTTKDMVALSVGVELKTSKTRGNYNGQLGLPVTILETDPETEVAVLEMGMSEPGEMERISRVTRADIAIVTNIGFSHIESLGSRENIGAEKLKVADYMPKDGVLILNGDEPILRNDGHPQRKVYCSVSDSSCDCYASDILERDEQTHFNAHIFGNIVPITLKTLGIHNVSNSLFALASAYLLGVGMEKTAVALSCFETSGLRQRIYKKNNYTVIADCYNASPESMQAALSVLAEQKGRKIAVLGDMLELGSFAPHLHEKVGQYVLESKTDILLTVGSLAKSIAIPCDGKIEVYSFEDGEYDKAAGKLRDILKDGDTILYKASNRMKLQKIIELV